MTKDNKVVKAIAGTVIAGLLVGTGFGIGATTVEPTIITETINVPVVTEKVVEVVKEVPVNVTVEKIVEVEDESFKVMACDRLMYDDISECVKEVTKEDIALKNVLNFIEQDFNEITDLLEDEDLVKDEDDVKLIKVYDDFEDIVIEESDYDDNEYEFTVKIKVDDDGDKRYFYVTISNEDGELEIKNITE